jgi:glutathione synthase/RimK-type ligase-like ATP-grasp enzyme
MNLESTTACGARLTSFKIDRRVAANLNAGASREGGAGPGGREMAVLIICEAVDLHASAITWALEQCGTDVMRWHPAPPWAPAGAVRFDGTSVDYRFAANGGEITPSSVEAVWMRRWSRPVFPLSFREGDRRASHDELTAYHRGLLELLPRDILWANPLGDRVSANYKLRQLATAISVGLPIPRTLVTDDASQAREFVASEPDGEVIYKPFHSLHWQRAGNEIYRTATTPVTTADFDDPRALAWSPGIFQKFVPKAFELRISIFGRTCVSAKIFDQDPIDWRTRQSDMKVGPCALPEAVETKLHALMDALGLVMGMVDLIVTPDGDYVFLEVNEQGQFLWVEDMCPEIPLLDTAARFFASANPLFRAEAVSSSALAYADFLETGIGKYEEEGRAFSEAGGLSNHSLLKDCEGKGEEQSVGAK